MRQISLAIILALAPLNVAAQTTLQADPPHHEWKAAWITHPTAPLREPLVLHFRRTLDLPSVPAAYTVRVSADNRFILYVNGKRVGDGPARGDLTHWRYERFDLAPYLQPGHNLITATVWNFGVYAPVAQMSDRTAFLLESEAAGPTGISTPDGWLVEAEPGQRPLDRSSVTIKTYFASGPGEEIDASKYDWNWNGDTPGPNWVPAASPMRDSIFPGTNHAHSADTTGDNPWGLIPDELPHMEYSTLQWVRQCDRRSSAVIQSPSDAEKKAPMSLVQNQPPFTPDFPSSLYKLPAILNCTFCLTAKPSLPPIPNSSSPAARAPISSSPTPKPSTTRTSIRATAMPSKTAKPSA